MTLVSTNGALSLPVIQRGSSGSPTPTSVTLNALDEACGNVFQSPVTDTITKIGFRVGAVAAGNLDVRIETLSSGLPSGTLWGTNTNYVLALAGTEDNTWIEVTLTSAASVTRGDIFAVVVNHIDNDTAAHSIQFSFADATGQGPPYCVNKPSGSWVLASGAPMFSLYFSTAGYAPLRETYPISAINTKTFTSASTPDHIGNKITPPYKCVVEGAWIWADLDGNGTVELWDAAGNVLATASLDANIAPSTAAINGSYYFNTDVPLTAGSSYYLIVIEPTANIAIYEYAFGDANVKAQFVGSSVVATSAKDPTDSSDFTDTTTSIYAMGLLISEIDDGAAAASGGNVNILAGKL